MHFLFIFKTSKKIDIRDIKYNVVSRKGKLSAKQIGKISADSFEFGVLDSVCTSICALF